MSVAVSKRDRGIDRVSPELKTHLRQVIGGIVCASCSGVASGRLRLVLGWEDGPPCSNRLEVAVLLYLSPCIYQGEGVPFGVTLYKITQDRRNSRYYISVSVPYKDR